jgi:hypothetical protein
MPAPGCRRFFPPFLAVCLLAAAPLFAFGGRGVNPAYDGELAFGPQLLRFDDGCLFVDGAVTAGTFFNDLKRFDVGGRFEFRKRGQLVTEYPQALTTSVRLVGSRCGAESPYGPAAVFNGGSYALRITAQWKDGMDMTPIALAPEAAQCVAVADPDQPFGDTIPVVTCRITVDGSGIPLDRHLIVSVFSVDGQRLARLSAAP